MAEYPLLSSWLLEIFPDEEFLSTLKETSKDNTNGVYMLDDESIVLNFDCIKNKYNKGIKSSDALFIINTVKDKEELIWVEFKNGNLLDGNGELKEKKLYDIIIKIYDSVNIFQNYVCNNSSDDFEKIKKNVIQYLREHSRFILVFNEDKNTERTELWNHFAVLADEKTIKLKGFEKIQNRFEGYLHKDVIAFSSKDFINVITEYKNHNAFYSLVNH